MARNPSLFTLGSMTGAGIDPCLTPHCEMSCLFDDAVRGGDTAGGSQGLLASNIDVSEPDKQIRIHAERPGMGENDVEVS